LAGSALLVRLNGVLCFVVETRVTNEDAGTFYS